MSLLDKFSTALFIIVVQYYRDAILAQGESDIDDDSGAATDSEFVKLVLSLVPAIVCIFGSMLTMIINLDKFKTSQPPRRYHPSRGRILYII